MPRAGQVRVTLTRAIAAAMAEWLEKYLRTEEPFEIENAHALQAQFRKSAIRKRLPGAFTILLERKTHGFFRYQLELHAVTRGGSGLPLAVADGFRICSDALTGGRGRKSLELPDLERRAAGDIKHLDERHRARVRKRAHHGHRVQDWHRRGNTILGVAEPYPEK